MIIWFEEKHDNRFIEGADQESILAHVLEERLSDTYDGVSVWYGKETELARKYLERGMATRFMQSRIAYEYEGWEVITVEKI